MNDFEKPFRDALIDLEVAPPEGGWPPIHAALDRKGFDYRTYGLLLLLLLLIGVGSLVTYHVAIHALDQQRAATVAGRAGSSDGVSSSVLSSAAEHTVEVPCANTTSLQDAYADAGGAFVRDDAGAVADSYREVACTPSVNAGYVPGRSLAGNTSTGQRPEVGRSDDNATAADIARRVIRRKPRGEVSMQNSVQASGEGETLVRRKDRAQRVRTALVTTDTDSQRAVRESQQARDGEIMARGNSAGVGRERESGRDSVVQAYNGPPMPVRKHKAPVGDAATPAPFEHLKNIREAEETTKTPQRDSVEEKKREERERSKWSLQVQGGANYTFKKMDPARDLYYVTGLNNKNQASWKNAGYQVGVTARYPLARRTTMTAGISWNMLREHTDYNYYNIISDSVAVKGVAGKSIEVKGYSTVRTNDVTNTLHYLGVHVGLIQQVTFLRYERNILLGLNVNRQLAATHRTQNAEHRFTVNSMRIAVRAGLEHRVALSPNHVLTLTPFFEQSFGSVYSEESVYTLQPIQLGLDIGLILPFYKRK